jgi:hypothetical protein
MGGGRPGALMDKSVPKFSVQSWARTNVAFGRHVAGMAAAAVQGVLVRASGNGGEHLGAVAGGAGSATVNARAAHDFSPFPPPSLADVGGADCSR